MKKAIMLAVWLCLFACVVTAQSEYYFPGKDSFDPDIPSPEDFLGYQVGDHHTRYDRGSRLQTKT